MGTSIQISPSNEAEVQPRRLALTSIHPRNLLSFAPHTEPLPLESLNILIGANGSGKSNLLDAIGLLQAAALGELTDHIVKRGGGVADWIWRGQEADRTAKLEVIVQYPDGKSEGVSDDLHYWIEFEEGKKHEINVVGERLEDKPTNNQTNIRIYMEYADDGVVLSPSSTLSKQFKTQLPYFLLTGANAHESVLSQRWPKENYSELAYVSKLFSSFRLYRDWSFGRTSSVRDDKRIGVLEDQLAEDADNLGLILNNLKDEDEAGDKLASYLKEFLEGARRLSTKIVGQHLQFGLSEVGLKGVTPPGRLSDGTLRWLSLMAVLLNPTPPPLICLEEPESGLHPNIIPVLAELLLDTAQRTQLIVTTHSRALVDSFTDNPEYVVVFDKEDGATKMRRLERSRLHDWLEEYETLGPLWASGVIGGNRF